MAGTLVRNSMERLIMSKPPTNQALSDVSQEEREVIEIIRNIHELRETGMHEEAQRLQIELDKFCRRDPPDALFSQRIRHHTLIDDNPSSG
jgi:hypothetical protein